MHLPKSLRVENIKCYEAPEVNSSVIELPDSADPVLYLCGLREEQVLTALKSHMASTDLVFPFGDIIKSNNPGKTPNLLHRNDDSLLKLSTVAFNTDIRRFMEKLSERPNPYIMVEIPAAIRSSGELLFTSYPNQSYSITRYSFREPYSDYHTAWVAPHLSLFDLSELDISNLTHNDTASIFQSIAMACDYAHGKKISHGDVKPGNVLIHKESGKWRGILFDWEGAAKFNHQLQSTTGTYKESTYRQCDKDNLASAQFDMFSLAISIFELNARLSEFMESYQTKKAFYADLEKIINKILNGSDSKTETIKEIKQNLKKQLPENFQDALAALIYEMTKNDKSSRPTAISVAEELSKISGLT